MSFAGHVFDMIARMKANERRKRRPFDREVDAKAMQIRSQFLQPATEDELCAIRQKMELQRRSERKMELILLIISIILLVLAGWWFF